MKPLRNHIHTALSQTSPTKAPKVHNLLQTTKGYQNIEQKIIEMMVQEHISATACIPHLEAQL
ncbi:hypothetical protein V6R21_24830 [Limibacter armeniacum]|uniref:hypothetical protein n=1 Tax=Limibacter armeniacum TaxID=466084 RepID=UPI002FE5030A